MKRFVEGVDRGQSTLLPECLDDWIGEDNPVRVIDAFVDALDLSELGFEGVTPAVTGRPAYHPLVLLKLYIYGYLNRVQSSRRLEREAGRNFEVTYGDVSLGLDIDPEKGTADSGDLEIDLPNLFVAVAEAAEERKSAVALLIDEIQYFRHPELGALIRAMHKVQQRQLPMVLLGAGLPILPGLAGELKSYAERLFSFPDIGALSQADTAKALREPALAAGVAFEPKALEEVYRLTKGYPYFLQEWGYQAWNLAMTSPITLKVVENATATVIPRLDRNFFRVRFDRLTPSEKSFLRAMADMGPGDHRTGDIAETLNVKVTSLGPVRAKLIRKGMIYSPAHGDMAFTVPLFDEFMVRAMPTFKHYG